MSTGFKGSAGGHQPVKISGDHVPVFLRNVVEEIQAVAKGCAGEILKAVPMNLKRSAGSSQLVKIGSNLPALPTGFRREEEDGNAFRGGNG
ncbi:MAG TPA: hypothetical protein VFB98_07360 [Candidatus Deferrimicrobium sp.]|nr:hypothetical protein [Candidatus Deferrimicrobium sp.]